VGWGRPVVIHASDSQLSLLSVNSRQLLLEIIAISCPHCDPANTIIQRNQTNTVCIADDPLRPVTFDGRCDLISGCLEIGFQLLPAIKFDASFLVYINAIAINDVVI